MFSISHGSDGSFRLEIHSSPSDLAPADARRLRAVLLGLARQVGPGRGGDDGGPTGPEGDRKSHHDEGDGRTRVIADVV